MWKAEAWLSEDKSKAKASEFFFVREAFIVISLGRIRGFWRGLIHFKILLGFSRLSTTGLGSPIPDSSVTLIFNVVCEK